MSKIKKNHAIHCTGLQKNVATIAGTSHVQESGEAPVPYPRYKRPWTQQTFLYNPHESAITTKFYSISLFVYSCL